MPTNGSAESLHDDTNSPRSYSIPTPPQNNVDDNPPYHAKKMTIQVTDPQKHSEGPQGAYISYLVTTMVLFSFSFALIHTHAPSFIHVWDSSQLIIMTMIH